MNDNEIITALGKHHFSKAMKPLYKYRPVVIKFVKQYGGTKEDAEDIFQDALVLLCRKIDQGNFHLSASLNTYLYGISKNLWREEIRKRNKMIVIAPDNDLSAEDEVFIQSETKYQQAEDAFKLLGEKCQKLLMLFYYHKKTMLEIAPLLDFSNERVAKNQKYRCMEKAKEYYSDLKTKY